MTRSITRTLPLLAALFSFILFSSTSQAQLLGKRHYSNRMYVKVDKQKKEADRRSMETTASATESTRTTDELALLPQRNADCLGGNETNVSPLRKVSQRIASVVPRVHNNTNRQQTTATQAQTSNSSVTPQFVKTVNVTAATDDADGSSIANILIILGVILIIVAIVSLILEVATAGWVGLLIAGLLIILLAYLLF